MTTAPAPARPTALRGALTRYRVLAYATGVFLLLLTAEVICKYGFGIELGNFIPIIHGWLYLIYVIVAVDLWMRTRLNTGRMVLVVLAGTIPFMSFVAERWVTHRVAPMVARASAGASVGSPE